MTSERGDFRLEVAGLATPGDAYGLPTWPAPYLVLPGTRMCVSLTCNTCVPGATCKDLPLSVTGPIEQDDDGCYTPTAPGEVEWSVGLPCGRFGEPPDRIRMRVVDPDDVVAEVFDPFPAFRHLLAADAPQEAEGSVEAEYFGTPWDEQLGWPLQVVAGVQTGLSVRLRDTSSGHVVVWKKADGEVTWTTTAGRPPITYPGDDFSLLAFAGTEAEASLRIGDRTWPLGSIVGVPAETAASLDVAGIVLHENRVGEAPADHVSYPAYVRALARDAEGRPLIGLPVTWSVDRGAIAVHPHSAAGELAELDDACVPPEENSGPREVVLRATHGDLSEAVTLRWHKPARTPSEVDEPLPWTPDAECLAAEAEEAGEGCGCRAADPSAAALVLLAVLALRRRRPRTARKIVISSSCLVLPVLTACDDAPPDRPPALRPAEVHELGTVPAPASRGGHSVRVREGGLWLLRAGDQAVFATTPDLDASDGVYPLHAARDDDGELRDLIPFTADEARLHQKSWFDGSRLLRVYLWPSAVVRDAESARLLIVYNKWLPGEGGAGPEYIGSSIAVWRDDLKGEPERPLLGSGAEPTLMFGADEPRLAAALAVDDELYAFGCDADDQCVLARVPLADALHRDAWRFFAEPDGWIDEPARATPRFQAAPVFSVHHSAYADTYVAVYAVPDTASIVIRTAPRLEGPWSDPAEIHRVWQTTPFVTVDTALFHPELARDGGRVDILTYRIDPGGLQLAEVRWE